MDLLFSAIAIAAAAAAAVGVNEGVDLDAPELVLEAVPSRVRLQQ